jgi:hypothetical protein
MGRYGKGPTAIVEEMARSSHRSTLFWWLVDHHDEVVAASAGRRFHWGALCERFEKIGLTDLTGKPANPHTARITWQRVRRMVAEARQRQAAEAERRPGSSPPSRLPRDWAPAPLQQPQTVPTAQARAALSGPPPVSVAGAPGDVPLDPMSKEALLALVPPGMPEWTAPQGDFVKPGQSPRVQAMMLKAEALLRQADRHHGPPIKRREE